LGAACATVPPWACPLTNCALKSPLAAAGPGFPDGVRFFTVGSDQKDTRSACPFGGEPNGPEPSKKEYLKYMRGMGKVADMSIEERRAYALKHQKEWKEKAESEDMEAEYRKAHKKDLIDVSKPGAEAVNSTQWSALREENKFDYLIVFYAPWCPHCKAFVTNANAPINALSESLERASGPKVVKFDMEASTSPLVLEGVPTIYLFKKSGEASEFKGDISAGNLEALMAFALDEPRPAAQTQALVTTKVTQHSKEQTAPSWSCPLMNCVLKSPLATAGPAFPDGVRFFAAGSVGTDTRAVCPFGDDDGPEPSKKEYMKYMKAMDGIGDMTVEQRRKWAIEHEEEFLNAPVVEKKIKDPRVDVMATGVEAVNSTTWSELRNANKFDFLIAFYAPWCQHCKAFVTSANAPIKALSATLERVNGPKVVTFDIVASTPPLVIDSVPTVYLFKKNGQATPFKEDPHNMEALVAFALDKPAPAAQALVEKQVSRHLRSSEARLLADPEEAAGGKKEDLTKKMPLKAAEQGFEGEKVKHTDGKTETSDWQSEYGASPKSAPKKSASVHNVLSVTLLLALTVALVIQ